VRRCSRLLGQRAGPKHHANLEVEAADCSQGCVVPKALGAAVDAMPTTIGKRVRGSLLRIKGSSG
jgi:hypothetical protein